MANKTLLMTKIRQILRSFTMGGKSGHLDHPSPISFDQEEHWYSILFLVNRFRIYVVKASGFSNKSTHSVFYSSGIEIADDNKPGRR